MVDFNVSCKSLLPSKRTLWTAFAISMLCMLFIVERQAGLRPGSQDPTELYAPEMFVSESAALNDGDNKGPYIWDADSLGAITASDKFDRQRTTSTSTKFGMLPSKFTDRRQKQTNPSAPVYSTLR